MGQQDYANANNYLRQIRDYRDAALRRSLVPPGFAVPATSDPMACITRCPTAVATSRSTRCAAASQLIRQRRPAGRTHLTLAFHAGS